MRWYYQLAYRMMSLYWKIVNPITVGVSLLMVKEGAIILVKHTYLDKLSLFQRISA